MTDTSNKNNCGVDNIAAVFLKCFYMPVGKGRFENAVFEALYLLKSFARQHVLLSLVPVPYEKSSLRKSSR